MSLSQSRPTEAHQLADHSADRRMLMLAAMALVVGTGGAFGAWLLLKLIAVATNLFWFGRFSTDSVDIADAALGPVMVAIPRSEERRVGKECVSTCRFRWSP